MKFLTKCSFVKLIIYNGIFSHMLIATKEAVYILVYNVNKCFIPQKYRNKVF